MLSAMEMTQCPDLEIPVHVMRHVVQVESSFNPYAIGVVGGALVRQPVSLAEAVATARDLEQRGYNFSVGLAQINRHNLAKYGLASYEQAFSVCSNLRVGARILSECHARAGADWGKAFSCYYSGNFSTGYQHGYVDKVFASMRRSGALPADVDSAKNLAPPSRRRDGKDTPVLRGVAASRMDLAPAREAEQPADPAFVGAMIAEAAPSPATPSALPAAPGHLAGTHQAGEAVETPASPPVTPPQEDGPVVLQPPRAPVVVAAASSAAASVPAATVPGSAMRQTETEGSSSSPPPPAVDGAFVF
jgi:type IV secretion system protein VirB1